MATILILVGTESGNAQMVADALQPVLASAGHAVDVTDKAATAAEVATYYIDTGPLEIPILIGIMIVKFVLVLMWFMHLKFDSPLFTKTFVAGLAMAVVVYVAVLATFEFWS